MDVCAVLAVCPAWPSGSATPNSSHFPYPCNNHHGTLDRLALAQLCLFNTNAQVILPRTMLRARNPRSLVVQAGQYLPIHHAQLEMGEELSLIFA